MARRPDRHDALPLRLGGFELYIEGRTEHETDDTWDATWLAGAASCDADGSTITIPGIVLTSWSVQRFRDSLAELERSHTGCALLAAEGPELSVCVRPSKTAGHLSVRVDMTPRHASQGHWFAFEVDEARVSAIIAQCRAILEAFPTRELADAHDAPGQSPS
jgi:hypothetical protein